MGQISINNALTEGGKCLCREIFNVVKMFPQCLDHFASSFIDTKLGEPGGIFRGVNIVLKKNAQEESSSGPGSRSCAPWGVTVAYNVLFSPEKWVL